LSYNQKYLKATYFKIPIGTCKDVFLDRLLNKERDALLYDKLNFFILTPYNPVLTD